MPSVLKSNHAIVDSVLGIIKIISYANYSDCFFFFIPSEAHAIGV